MPIVDRIYSEILGFTIYEDEQIVEVEFENYILELDIMSFQNLEINKSTIAGVIFAENVRQNHKNIEGAN